ncbi:MAG: hypothetical protein J0L88_07180 [Xanthomonadales bacterium]|nr:hypothetical protein [Xanthomonadales bacterium]
MSMREATTRARAALTALENMKSICADLAPLDTPMTPEQLQQRARLIHGILRTRQQMQLLRDRAIDLDEALQRFRARRAEIDAVARSTAASAAPAAGEGRRVA